MRYLPLLLLLAVPISACDDAVDIADETAVAVIESPADTSTGVTGMATFTQSGDVLGIELTLDGVEPTTTHGFHIHAVGDCGRGDHDGDGFAEVAGAAMGHYDPDNTMNHGGPRDPITAKHAGDLGNITVNANGSVTLQARSNQLSLSGDRPVIGLAVMLHSMPDDLQTDPGGNSGDRIACGVVRRTAD